MEAQHFVNEGAFLSFAQKSINSSLKVLRQERKGPSEYLDGAIHNLENATILTTKGLKKYKKKEGNVPEICKQIINLWTKSILDSTYEKETGLVESKFPKEKIQDVHHILDELNQLQDRILLFYKMSHPQDTSLEPSRMLNEVLGAELAEVIHWRKGALAYMVAATVQNDKERQKEEKIDEFLSIAANELGLMMRVRKPVKAQDDDLISHGIYSSTHLLALMYAGEACLWAVKLGLPFKEKGLAFLTQYCKAVDTLSPEHGWNSVRAKEMMEEINSI